MGLSVTQSLFLVVGQGRGMMVAVPTVAAVGHTEMPRHWLSNHEAGQMPLRRVVRGSKSSKCGVGVMNTEP